MKLFYVDVILHYYCICTCFVLLACLKLLCWAMYFQGIGYKIRNKQAEFTHFCCPKNWVNLKLKTNELKFK